MDDVSASLNPLEKVSLPPNEMWNYLKRETIRKAYISGTNGKEHVYICVAQNGRKYKSKVMGANYVLLSLEEETTIVYDEEA
jgi:hypothetical protein